MNEIVKKYDFYNCADINHALEVMNKHQEWNIVGFYPTGFGNYVRVVFYTYCFKQK